MKRWSQLAVVFCLAALALPARAQQQQAERPEPAELQVVPSALTLEVGERATLKASVKDAAGNVLDLPVLFFSLGRRQVGVSPAGEVEAYRPGKAFILARVPKDPDDTSRRSQPLLEARIPVTVPNPPISSIEP
ncbi:MAG: Ig domain-containing protein, partial [Acidobacteriota bacterium]